MNKEIATQLFASLASGIRLEGRFQRYRANIPLMLDLIAFLTDECCAGHPELCASLRSASSCSPALLPTLTPQTACDCQE